MSDITYKEAEALTYFFDDNEVNGITNFIPGSTVVGIIEEAREMKTNYRTFGSQMQAVVKYNKGTSYEDILRRIYIKYVYQGNKDSNELEILYDDIFELLSRASSEYELQDIDGQKTLLITNPSIFWNLSNYLVIQID